MVVRIITTIVLFFLSPVSMAMTKYITIIDAGSSGTRLYIYQVEGMHADIPAIQPAPYPLTQGQTVWTKKITPSLDSFASHPEDIESYIRPLLDFATEKLSNVHANTSEVVFHVYGTAGMRLLPKEKQELIYNKIVNFINSSFPYHVIPASLNNVKTISGQEEAVYDWLSVNYLDNQLVGQTVGVIDMGGASTQIAFAAESAPNPDDIAPVRIGNHTYHLYAKSYLGLGQVQARLNLGTADCYPINYRFKGEQVGQGNYNTCVNWLSKILNQGTYSLRLDIPTLPNKTFYAISGYYYTRTFFDKDNLSWKSNEMKELGSSFCQREWSGLSRQYPNDNYLGNYCFNVAYFNTLLTQGFGFSHTATNIKTAKMIQDKEISWTIGAAMKVYDEYHENSRI